MMVAHQKESANRLQTVIDEDQRPGHEHYSRIFAFHVDVPVLVVRFQV